MMVRAGVYGLMLRDVGDVVSLRRPSDFSVRWMELVDPDTPE